MELQIKIIGYLLILLASCHLVFPSYFQWREQLQPLSLINRQMMYVHTFFIALVVLLMGILCITVPWELVSSPLGKKISLGLAIFWTVRLLTQFFGYSSELWRGKTFETSIHIVFSLLWVYFSGIFFLAYIG